MKERFSKLLLGEDITRGCKGVSTALALSNAISNLADLQHQFLRSFGNWNHCQKNRWRREMDRLLSLTNYMIEFVLAKQHGANGRTLEIMTLKARADIHINLPAFQKLDSMLIHAEGGSRAKGRSSSARQSKRWWLTSPQVPTAGLSNIERKKLVHQDKVVQQVFKAAKSINENVLLKMPVPDVIREVLPKASNFSFLESILKYVTWTLQWREKYSGRHK